MYLADQAQISGYWKASKPENGYRSLLSRVSIPDLPVLRASRTCSAVRKVRMIELTWERGFRIDNWCWATKSREHFQEEVRGPGWGVGVFVWADSALHGLVAFAAPDYGTNAVCMLANAS